MTQRRTPYSDTPIPDNFNRTGRPPPIDLDYSDPRIVQGLTSPRLVDRVNKMVQTGEVTREQAELLMVDLRQMRRAIHGERALPGEFLGRDDLPHQPMPYADEEPYIHDRQPGSQKHAVMREAVERMDADRIGDTLIAQMREHAPEDSTWARADPAYRPPGERAAHEEAREPTLHETLQAAAAMHQGE